MRAHYVAALAYSLTLAAATAAQGAPAWSEGTHYFLVEPARPTSVPPGKVEVTEAFSCGCPACNGFLPVMRKLSQSLPPNAVVDYLPVSFNAGEDWPMFGAVWKTGELSIDPAAHDDLVLAYHVDGTPTIIVNGKYRLHAESAGGTDQLIELVNWLVAMESGKERQRGKASSRVAARAVTFND
jgi:thiol:disulfide interchange protein DsbA